MNKEFEYSELYGNVLRTCDEVGFALLSIQRSAQIMASFLVWGDNVGFVCTDKVMCDIEHIMEKYSLCDGKVPNKDFLKELAYWYSLYDTEGDSAFESSYNLLYRRYGFRIVK